MAKKTLTVPKDSPENKKQAKNLKPHKYEKEEKIKVPGPVFDEMIKKRAYELYLERGGIHGNHDKDWNDAEREIRTMYVEDK